MRSLTRLPEPQIITDRGAQWLASLLASGNLRPDSTKYGNSAIRIQLNSMSFNKCFYCESMLKQMPKEIDHFVEVSVNLNLSYTWTNLYLSCDNCNNKIDANTIPIHQVLDPCNNTDIEIQEHILFNDEIITAKDNSQIGLDTIRKYRLHSEVLDMKRMKQLKVFFRVLDDIRKGQIADGGRELLQEEISTINHFQQVDQPYSLMFKNIIDTI